MWINGTSPSIDGDVLHNNGGDYPLSCAYVCFAKIPAERSIFVYIYPYGYTRLICAGRMKPHP
jgi:hypothetical protein